MESPSLQGFQSSTRCLVEETVNYSWNRGKAWIGIGRMIPSHPCPGRDPSHHPSLFPAVSNTPSVPFLMGWEQLGVGSRDFCFPSLFQLPPGAQAGWEPPRKGHLRRNPLKTTWVFPEALVHINIHINIHVNIHVNISMGISKSLEGTWRTPCTTTAAGHQKSFFFFREIFFFLCFPPPSLASCCPSIHGRGPMEGMRVMDVAPWCHPRLDGAWAAGSVPAHGTE